MNSVIVTLLQNAAILLAMMVVFDFLTSRSLLHAQWQRLVLAGIILGTLCIGLMITAFRFESGVIFDTRSVLLSLSGLFLGQIPTFFAMAMATLYRFWQGGTGVWPGIGVILSTGGIGLIWRHFRQRPLVDISVRELYGFGVVVHLNMLAFMLTLPWSVALPVISEVGLPVLLVYPIATIALGWLLANRLQRESAAAALEASEARYRGVFESANVGKSITLLTGEINVNQAFCDMLGYSQEELRGKTWQELVPPEEIVQTNEILAALTRGEKDEVRFERRYMHRNGSCVWTDYSATLERDSDKNPLYFIVTLVDITDRKRAEELNKENEARFQVAQDLTPDGFTILQPVRNEKAEIVDFVWKYENPAIARINGTDPKVVVGKQLLDLFPEQRGTFVFETYLHVANTGETQVIEEIGVEDILSKPMWLRLVVVSIGSNIAIHTQNIAERKLAEDAFKLQAQRADTLLQLPTLADGVDEHGFIQRGMELAEQLTGSKISFIHFIKEGGEEIELVAWSHDTLERYCTAASDSHYPVSKAGIWADALRVGRPVIFNDYPNYPHKKGLPEGHSALERFISVPVIESGQVVMVVAVGNKEKEYTDFDSESVQLIATAIWQIVNKARAAESAIEALARIEKLAKHVPGALYQFQMWPDGTACLPYASERIKQLYGVLPEQVVEDATAVFAAIHPDDVEQVNQSIQESARTLQIWSNLHRVSFPDGRTIWVEAQATPIVQPDESVLWHGYVVVKLNWPQTSGCSNNSVPPSQASYPRCERAA